MNENSAQLADYRIENVEPPPISGDEASRHRQYWIVAGLTALLVGLGHLGIVESTLGVYLLLESLIVVLAFIIGFFALIRYYSNRGILYFYAGVGFLSIGILEFMRLLAAATGFVSSYFAGTVDHDHYFLWSSTLIHLYVGLIMLVAVWDTQGLQSRLTGDTRRIEWGVGVMTALCAAVILFAPVPAKMSGLGVSRPLELIPAALWIVSSVLVYRHGEWRRDTFMHWLLLALIMAAGAALFLYPFCDGLTTAHTLLAQVLKLTVFSLVLVGLGNSMFELVQRVESSRRTVQQLNDSLQKEIGERRQAERLLLASQTDLAEAQQIAHLGSWTWEIRSDQCYLTDEMLQILDLPASSHPSASPQMFSAEKVRSCIHPEDLPSLDKLIEQSIRDKTDWETYCRIVRQDGETRVLMLRGRVLLDESGNMVRFRGTAQDLTEIVQTQQRLRETAELLATSNRDLEEFAYIASHDLQEPLRKISAFTDRVLARYSDGLDETGRDYLDRVRRSALRMQNLINDILTLSRVNTQQTPFVNVALNRVVGEALEDLAAYIQEGGARITVDPALPKIQGDPAQIRQLFQNLISNGLKFCLPGRAPVLTIATAKPHLLINGAPFATVKVEDEGIGFDARYIERIFQPFQRLHSRSKFEGTGMGLSICRRIVERHGGQIRAESEPGQGSRFFVTLPLEQLEPTEMHASRPLEFAGAGESSPEAD